MKKFLLACSLAMGILLTGQNAAHAEDVWVASDGYNDYYVMTETLTLDTVAHVDIKTVHPDQSRVVLRFDFGMAYGGTWRLSDSGEYRSVSGAPQWVQNAYHEVEYLLRDE
ncbi:MAG: hypothetical protein MR630_04495 [Selenomonas sp.]|uniref:hypothetical protein n=1 Tax=Selenomonas sp. TaxID=2053611 RepID=UPI0025D57723|nr:hypothetical protein [Selenomonas sp.]MCI6231854.1 hypothetical protein [Selenomonas sp.]